MTAAYNELLRIVDPTATRTERAVAMRTFAEDLDWVPNYEPTERIGPEVATGHLIVEHGLENAAAISFLKGPTRAIDVRPDHLRSILSISYNNLIEWHLLISSYDARWINNLVDVRDHERADTVIPIAPETIYSRVSYVALARVINEKAISRTIRPCDDILIRVVTRWKSLLKAELPSITSRNIATLFNALIFVRGCEDSRANDLTRPSRLLMTGLGAEPDNALDLCAILSSVLERSGIDQPLSAYINTQELVPLNSLDRATVLRIFKDMYAPQGAEYDFNFALMSKHALSRIYEKYVSIFSYDERSAGQISLFPEAPRLNTSSKTGAIYTPQFIAGFFARFLRENLTPRFFRELRSIDPACGSGLFLRSLLELQCDPLAPGITNASVSQAFSRSEGVDRDANACEAARLSLALLHLSVTGRLPFLEELKIINLDSFSAYQRGIVASRQYSAILSNPPYIKLDHLSSDERDVYQNFLGAQFSGRMDAYIPFVDLCLRLSADDGIVCLVLPQTFLTATNAKSLRRKIHGEFDVRCLIDLSAVQVFESVGIYTILLIIQRRRNSAIANRAATVAIVTESVGAALQMCLEEANVSNEYFNVFQIEQEYFDQQEWHIITPDYARTKRRLNQVPKLALFMNVVQGFVTGQDKVFLRPKQIVPRGEEDAYIDYLPDRQIGRYIIPKKSDEVVFFPYRDGAPLEEEEVKDRFPKTWGYLESNKAVLSTRKSARESSEWWRPTRSRPQTILRPKIICPHLMLTPRFAVDLAGNFAISRSPFVIAKDLGEEATLLRFFCAVLNSTVCNWYLRASAPKYGRGYSRLEVSSLSNLPVPDLQRVDSRRVISISDKVEEITRKYSVHLDDEIDREVSDLYGFSASERTELFDL